MYCLFELVLILLVVDRTELCRFSGQKIYPGRGIRFIRSDSQVFLFANSKCKRYFHNKLKPSKLTWTAMYRKQHKKDLAQEAVKKRHHATKSLTPGLLWEQLWKSFKRERSEKPEVRDAAREVGLRKIKERIKKTKDEKKAKKAEVASKQLFGLIMEIREAVEEAADSQALKNIQSQVRITQTYAFKFV
ncbi:putative ribosomal protein L24e [Helianthus debilis subsp. tardiflorus]